MKWSFIKTFFSWNWKKNLTCAKRLAVVTAGFGMGLLNVAEKAEELDELLSLEEVLWLLFDDGDCCDDLDPGEDLGDPPEVGLVLILLPLLLPSCKVLPGVKEGMIGVLFDGFKLDLLFPTTLFDWIGWSPALVRGFFLNCLRSLTIEEDFLLLVDDKPFGLVGDDDVFDDGDGNFGEAAWTKSIMELEPFLDLNEFEKDNVEVLLLLFELFEFPANFWLDGEDEALFGIDLTVTDVPEGIPLTLSFFSLFEFSANFWLVGLDFLLLVLTASLNDDFGLLSTFLTFVFSSSNNFLVMVVWPPSKEAGGFAGTAIGKKRRKYD